MQDKDFSVKLASQAAVVMVPGNKNFGSDFVSKNMPHLKDDTACVYSVQSGNNFSSSKISVHHLPGYLKLNEMLLYSAVLSGLGDRLPNPNPATRDQEVAQLLSSYRENPFSQKSLQKFFEIKVQRGELQLPEPVAGMPRIGPTCRSMANAVYDNYIKIVRDPSNPELPAPQTIEHALNFMKDFISSNRGSSKIPVNNTENAELNRTVKLICEVMKRNAPNAVERRKFDYKAVGINNHEDFSRSFYQRDLIGAMQKAMIKIDPNFVENLGVQDAKVRQNEQKRLIQNTTFNIATTENRTRPPGQPDPEPPEQRSTPGMGRGRSGSG
jgi:hypothetical protein